MATQVTTSAGLGNGTISYEVAQYYERVFLARAMKRLIHEQGAQKKTIPAGEGKVINFTRYTPLATVTALSAEATIGSEVDLTAANVSATLVEYANWAKIGKFLSTVSIDRNNKEKIELFGQWGQP